MGGDFENYAPINYFLAMLVSKIDFRLEESSIDTFFVPTKFGSVLHVLVRLSYFNGLETVIKRLKSEEESSSSLRVSVQGVKSLGSHFACLCQEFDFYEVKKSLFF